MQPIKKPSARLHARADLPAWKNILKKTAIHLHAFQDVRVFAATLDADADPPVILFNALLDS